MAETGKDLNFSILACLAESSQPSSIPDIGQILYPIKLLALNKGESRFDENTRRRLYNVIHGRIRTLLGLSQIEKVEGSHVYVLTSRGRDYYNQFSEAHAELISKIKDQIKHYSFDAQKKTNIQEIIENFDPAEPVNFAVLTCLAESYRSLTIQEITDALSSHKNKLGVEKETENDVFRALVNMRLITFARNGMADKADRPGGVSYELTEAGRRFYNEQREKHQEIIQEIIGDVFKVSFADVRTGMGALLTVINRSPDNVPPELKSAILEAARKLGAGKDKRQI